MSSLNSLFDDWNGDGEITHSSSSKDKLSKILDKVWKLWCHKTQREDYSHQDKDFTKAARAALAMGMSESELEKIIEGAARTEPRPRDPRDIRRLVGAISNPKTRKFALSAIEDNLPIVINPQYQQKITIQEVENILETKRIDWGDGDIESAVLLTEKFSINELIDIADKVSLIVGQVALFPSEVVRNIRKIDSGNYKVKKNAQRSSYGAGIEETNRTENIDFYADKAADSAFNRGISSNIVLAFHLQAPKGYWNEVSNLRRASKLPHDDIYSSLEKRFNWHPDDRESILKGKKR